MGLWRACCVESTVFLGGIKQFWMTVSVWKKNLVLEELACRKDENVTKVRAVVMSDRRLTVRMTGTIVRSLNDSEKGFIMSGQRLRTLGCCIKTTLPVTLPPPPRMFFFFYQRGYSSGWEGPILTWSESVWLIPFPETQIPPQRSSFWNCGQHPKGLDRPAESTSTWWLPPLLPGVGATSPAVCGFPRELLWRG